MKTGALIVAFLATAIYTASVGAETSPDLPKGTEVISGAPEWIAIESRTISTQLLKQSFELAPLRGRFRAFRVEADQGTVEIARTVVDFTEGNQEISNKFSIIAPGSRPHIVRFGASERAVHSLTLITATARNKRTLGRITLFGLHMPDIVVPPAPQRAGSQHLHSAARE